MDLILITSTVILFVALIFLTIIFLLILYALFSGAPYAPLSQNRIDTMKKLLKLKRNQRMVDLGSGDGRIVIAFAKEGIESHGYEINPLLVALSRFRIRQLGLQKKAFIHFKDFWGADLSGTDGITLYGISHIMGRLEKKLKKGFKGKVVTNYFKFPNLKPEKIENKVLYYEFN